MNRRLFLKSCLATGAISMLPGGLALALPQDGLRTQTRLMMDTTVSISVARASATLADEAIGRAFEQMLVSEHMFNRHSATGVLAMLNKQGSLKEAPISMLGLVQDALALHGSTGGAFDISVAPLVDAMKGGRFDSKDYTEARALADISAVELDGRGIRLKKRGMALTLDGIAKGSVVDAGAATMREFGVGNFIINAGGDIYASGQKAPGKGWTLAVESPEKDGNYPAIVQLSDRGMATSGNYERAGHLINPLSGARAEIYKSVTVSAPTVKEADALATALSAMPLERAKAFVAARPGCSALFIDHNGKVHSSNWA